MTSKMPLWHFEPKNYHSSEQSLRNKIHKILKKMLRLSVGINISIKMNRKRAPERSLDTLQVAALQQSKEPTTLAHENAN